MKNEKAHFIDTLSQSKTSANHGTVKCFVLSATRRRLTCTVDPDVKLFELPHEPILISGSQTIITLWKMWTMFRMIALGTIVLALAATIDASSRCETCLPRTLTLTPSDGAPGSVTPIIKMLPNTPQGCRQMNVKCNTPAGYPRTVMRFNGVGPPKVGKNVVALVSCFQSSWRTTYGGSYIYAESVKCTLN